MTVARPVAIPSGRDGVFLRQDREDKEFERIREPALRAAEIDLPARGVIASISAVGTKIAFDAIPNKVF
jgi:hypothetical protein